MADLFTISVSSVSDDYSADYGSVTPYIVNLGSTTSDGTWIVRTPIEGAFAPYTKIKITAINLVGTLWANNIDWIRFYFNDLYDPAVISTTKAALTANGITHIYGPPGHYYFGMTAHTVAGGTSAFYIANIIIDEIDAQPAISIFDANGDTVVLGASAYSPYTVYFAGTGVLAGSYLPDALTWTFDDRTGTRVVTRFETADPDFTIFGDAHHPDPRNYLVEHTYYRKPRQTARDHIFPILEIRSGTTATITMSATPDEVGPIKHAQKETRKLIKSRCFGPNNKVLLISETEEGQVFEHLIFNLNDGERAPITDA